MTTCDSSNSLVLVTGASGFVATHIVKHLLQTGYRVRGTVRSLKNDAKCQPIRELYPEAKHPVELVEADLLDADSWKAAVTGCDYVIHTASPVVLAQVEDEDTVIRLAVEGTLNVLRAANEVGSVKRVVMTGSSLTTAGNFFPSQDVSIPKTTRLTRLPRLKLLTSKARHRARRLLSISSTAMTSLLTSLFCAWH